MLLSLAARPTRVCQARPVRPQRVVVDGATYLEGLGREAQIAAHDGDAVVAVPGEVGEGGMDLTEEAGGEQLELDLLERAMVELLGGPKAPPNPTGPPKKE